MPKFKKSTLRSKNARKIGELQKKYVNVFSPKVCDNSVPKCLHFERPPTFTLAQNMASEAWQDACCLFPQSDLRLEVPSDVSTSDYGGNGIKLNFDLRYAGGGCLIVGAYQNVKPWGRGAVTGGSKEFVPWMSAVLRSLVLEDVLIRKPRIEALYGARTRPHTDGFRGFEPNWVRWVDEGARLLVRVDLHFRRSLVQIGDAMYVPLRMEASGSCVLIGFHEAHRAIVTSVNAGTVSTRADDMLQTPKPYRFRATHGVLQSVRTVGLLPDYAVIGTDEKRGVLVMRVGSDIKTSKKADSISFQQLLQDALANPPQSGPSVVPIGSTHSWASFDGSRHMHWLDGRPDTRRIHLSNHQLQQQIGAQIIRNSDPIWYYKKDQQQWAVYMNPAQWHTTPVGQLAWKRKFTAGVNIMF